MSDLSWAEVEAWLRRWRNSHAPNGGDKAATGWCALDDALDDLREHMHTGTPLADPVRTTEEH